jgi:hypothetical protein
MEQCSSHWVQAGEDVSWRGSLLPTLISSTELTDGQQQIDIVAPDEVLCHGDNRLAERYFTMMIRRVLSHIPTQLCYLDLTLELPLEAREQNLALAWLQTITEAGDRASAICDRELNELFVHEVAIPKVLL